ncbi:hemerythrin domain-containing protein [Streptomyces sp. WMMB303]|uniref:hemerythrin domain-containing protein n=1 Tax=Streptomyces sp. WMMB303 TaxID=3034154 RepID=UPI0023ECB257|nr:hemerythrin domain-containing protein [Streptomyces sp. WMMB303]MDF4249677.1 hemerythrin domain-containing protein [Streptomyces sp. WMMB303]
MTYRPDVLELLADEHAEVERLVVAYEATGDPERRAALAEQLVAGLERCARAEDQTLYPLVRKLPDGERRVAAARQRWSAAAATARELRDADPDRPAAGHRLDTLLDRLHEHAAYEEDEIHSPLRARLRRRERRRLGAAAASRLLESRSGAE